MRDSTAARSFVIERGYYDFFLIDRSGDIVFTVEKEDDFATNLNDGSWAETGLGEVYRRAFATSTGGRVVLSDFSTHRPSEGAPALFAAVALRGETDLEARGVLVLQVPTDRIRDIMQFTAGMDETGETYLVGEDYMMRSDSRFSDESTALKTEVRTPTVELALSGFTGVQLTTDYRGVEVLSAYSRIDVDGFSWAVIAEKDSAEIMTSGGRRLVTLVLSEVLVLLVSLLTVGALSIEGLGLADNRRSGSFCTDSLDDLES